MNYARKMLASIVLLIFYCSVYGQGFYIQDQIRLRVSDLKNSNVTSIKVMDESFEKFDETYHPLINFVSEYSINGEGAVKTITYWGSWLKGPSSSKMSIALLKDTILVQNNLLWQKNIMISKDVILDQDKERTSKYMNKLLRKVEQSFERCSPNYMHCFDQGVLNDTFLFDTPIYVEQYFLGSADSTDIEENKISLFENGENGVELKREYHFLPNGEIEIIWFTDEKKWRIYLFNGQGYLVQETQNTSPPIYTTKYLYNDQNLHVRTEEYMGDILHRKTKIIYSK